MIVTTQICVFGICVTVFIEVLYNDALFIYLLILIHFIYLLLLIPKVKFTMRCK